MFPRTLLSSALLTLIFASTVSADEAAPLSALAKMPVREVTVFKDGHALMLHSGKMPVEPSGDVLMDYLPAPVLGTFWPYSADKNVKLTAVVAGKRKVLVERTSLTVRELLEGNPGAEVTVSEMAMSGAATTPEGLTYTATIVGLPERNSKELEANAPPGEGEKLPEKSNLILLKTAEGVRAVNIDRIQQVTFRGPHKSSVADEEFRNLLRLKLDWGDRKPGKEADMGLLYLQKGIRWIPSYKVAIDGKGKATVQLEATLINEMVDLEDVTANLVVGVPKFDFAETPDPIGLSQTVAQLSPYFQRDAQTQYAFSNAIMSQAAGVSRPGRTHGRTFWRWSANRGRPRPGDRWLGEERGFVRLYAAPCHAQKRPADGRAGDVVRPEVRRRVHGGHRLRAPARNAADLELPAAGRDRQALSRPQGDAQAPPDEHEQIPHHDGPGIDHERRSGARPGNDDLHVRRRHARSAHHDGGRYPRQEDRQGDQPRAQRRKRGTATYWPRSISRA